MSVLKHTGAVVRTAAMSVLVLPILFGAVLAKRAPASTLASSVARNSVDMTPVGGIRQQPKAEPKRPAGRTARP